MQLIGSSTSPYVRKVRVYLEETGARCEFAAMNPSVVHPSSSLHGHENYELYLMRDDGSALFDSLLVLEYLDHTLPEARRLIPEAGEPRWDVLCWHSLAHGLIDATVMRLLDVRRPEALRSREVQAREEVRIARSLDSIEKNVAGQEWLCLDRLTLADVVLGVALQYIDFRYPHDWRSTRPTLAKWAARITSRPSFAKTLPPGFAPST